MCMAQVFAMKFDVMLFVKVYKQKFVLGVFSAVSFLFSFPSLFSLSLSFPSSKWPLISSEGILGL